MDGVVVVMCAAGDRAEAASIAAALVERRLAACVQMVPIESVYRWEGEVRQGTEVLLLIKTLAARFDAVQDCILATHGYAVPEIVAVPVSAGLGAYLAWVGGNVE